MAAGFSFGQSEKARSLGYEQERSPTLRGGEGGNQKPVALIASGFDGAMGSKAGNIGYEEEQAITTKSCGGGAASSVMAFTQNQRNEVRNLKGISGSLAAEPGMKQQTYVMAVDCRNGAERPDVNGTLQAKETGGQSLNLNNVVRTQGAMNPWDAQSARIYGSEGAWHSLNANENGGQSRDAVLVESSS